MTASLSGRVVVITGAAAGVGGGLAREAAARGAVVVLIDINDPAPMVDRITAAGGQARGLRGDVRDDSGMRALAVDVADHEGAVDVVCANPAAGAPGTIDSITAQTFHDVFDVSVVGVVRTVQAFLPGLRAARAEGRSPAVLITGSEHSLGVPPYVPPLLAYTTCKHALVGLAGCIRRDLSEEGIGVSLLCPSYVRTERAEAMAAESPDMAAVLDQYAQTTDLVAQRAFDGLARGDFVIPTNVVSRDFVVGLHREIIDAMEAVPPT